MCRRVRGAVGVVEEEVEEVEVEEEAAVVVVVVVVEEVKKGRQTTPGMQLLVLERNQGLIVVEEGRSPYRR